MRSTIYYRSHQQSKRLTDKDSIVLADFANSTSDAVFDETLKTALNVSLRQSPFLNVLGDDRVAATLQLMARPTNTSLTSDVTRELCQRAGSKAYIAGSIASLGSEYVLGLKAVNCQSGDTLAQAYQQLAESYPRQSAGAYRALGKMFALQGKYEKATEITSQALRLAPDQVFFKLDLAALL